MDLIDHFVTQKDILKFHLVPNYHCVNWSLIKGLICTINEGFKQLGTLKGGDCNNVAIDNFSEVGEWTHLGSRFVYRHKKLKWELIGRRKKLQTFVAGKLAKNQKKKKNFSLILKYS